MESLVPFLSHLNLLFSMHRVTRTISSLVGMILDILSSHWIKMKAYPRIVSSKHFNRNGKNTDEKRFIRNTQIYKMMRLLLL